MNNKELQDALEDVNKSAMIFISKARWDRTNLIPESYTWDILMPSQHQSVYGYTRLTKFLDILTSDKFPFDPKLSALVVAYGRVLSIPLFLDMMAGRFQTLYRQLRNVDKFERRRMTLGSLPIGPIRNFYEFTGSIEKRVRPLVRPLYDLYYDVTALFEEEAFEEDEVLLPEDEIRNSINRGIRTINENYTTLFANVVKQLQKDNFLETFVAEFNQKVYGFLKILSSYTSPNLTNLQLYVLYRFFTLSRLHEFKVITEDEQIPSVPPNQRVAFTQLYSDWVKKCHEPIKPVVRVAHLLKRPSYRHYFDSVASLIALVNENPIVLPQDLTNITTNEVKGPKHTKGGSHEDPLKFLSVSCNSNEEYPDDSFPHVSFRLVLQRG